MKHAPILDVPTRLYIGGEWRDASDGAEFEVTNPATGELLATVASGTTEDAIAAVDAAAAAFDDWAGRKPRERAEILRKAYELIVADKERFARLITLENGKALPDSRGEILYAASSFAGSPRRRSGTSATSCAPPPRAPASSHITSRPASRC